MEKDDDSSSASDTVETTAMIAPSLTANKPTFKRAQDMLQDKVKEHEKEKNTEGEFLALI